MRRAGARRPGLRGMEVGLAEPFNALRVQPVEVRVEQRAGGRGGAKIAFPLTRRDPGMERSLGVPDQSEPAG